MVVLFDLDETLLDHRTTERAAATALHRIADLKPYVDGDISAYRLVGGVASGPGCAG